MKKQRKLCMVIAFLFTCLNICGLWILPSTADDTETCRITGVSEPMPCENINLTAYLVPLQNEAIRSKMLQSCKDAEIDTLSHIYVSDEWVATDHTYEKYKALMAEVDKYGMKLLTRDYDVQNLVGKSDDEIRAVAEKYKSLPGFGGFYVVDEPYDANPYARVTNILREVCPDASVNVNFLPRGCYPEGEYIRRLTDYGALIGNNGSLSLDVYCFGTGGGVDEASLFTNYNDLRQAALLTGQNSAVYVQSIGLSGNYRRPSGSDLRYNMMAALAYGIKDIKFFTWSTPPGSEGSYTEAIFDRNGNPTDLYYDVCNINKKIHKLGTALAACDAVNVYHSKQKTAGAYDTIPDDLFVQVTNNADVIVSLMKERRSDGEYIMVVNKNFKAAQTIVLSLRNVPSVQLINDRTGNAESCKMTDKTVTLQLEAGDAALLRLPHGGYFPGDTDEQSDGNLALGASVHATSSLGTSGLFLYNLTDGITDGTGARLTSDNGSDQYVVLDLGRINEINRVDLYPSGTGITCGQLFPSEYSVRVSQDGENWTTVADISDDNRDRYKVPVLRFGKIQARYICIILKDFNNLNTMAELGEIQVYLDDGTVEDNIRTSYVDPASSEAINVALGKPVVAYSSSTDQPAWNCDHSFLTDGDMKRAWASELFRNKTPDSEEWIVVDLLDSYDVARIKLTPREIWNGLNVFPSDYEIQVSLDGENFTTVASVKGDNNPQTQDVRVLDFKPVTARFVKLLATKLTPSSTSGAGYAIEMSEMEVFCGKKDQPTDTDTMAQETDSSVETSDIISSEETSEALTSEESSEIISSGDTSDCLTTEETTVDSTGADISDNTTEADISVDPTETDVENKTTEEETSTSDRTVQTGETTSVETNAPGTNGCGSAVGVLGAVAIALLLAICVIVDKKHGENYNT